jgi:dUTP pyrophosphatase
MFEKIKIDSYYIGIIIKKMHLLKVKITDDCPNYDIVKEYYQNKANKVSYNNDSGLDLLIPNDVILSPGVSKINLGIQCEFVTRSHNITQASTYTEEKYTEVGESYMMVPRSSISSTPLSMANSIGIIDQGYRGPLIAAVRNHDPTNYKVAQGTRLFQIVAFDGKPIEVEVVNTLSETDRGSGGFGSTNK